VCSICHKPGHTKRNCPKLASFGTHDLPDELPDGWDERGGGGDGLQRDPGYKAAEAGFHADLGNQKREAAERAVAHQRLTAGAQCEVTTLAKQTTHASATATMKRKGALSGARRCGAITFAVAASATGLRGIHHSSDC